MLYYIIAVVSERTGRVDTRTEWTTITLKHTVVICVTACLRVNLNRTVSIIQEYREYRCHLVNINETAVHVVSLTCSVLVGIGISHIHVTFQPFLRSEVHVATHGETIISRTDIVTLVFQITDRRVVCGFLRTAGDLHGCI